MGPRARPRRPRKTIPPDFTGAGNRDPAASGPIAQTSVEVDALQALDPESVGLIDKSQGGFAVDMWAETDRALVQRLLPLVPPTLRSKPARDLLTRLLLTRATAPRGKPGGKSLLALRVELLLAMGDVKSALGLLQAAPPQLSNQRLAQIEVESRFFRNDNAGACTTVRRAAPQYSAPYWQQAAAFCMALGQDHARSAMIADILRERGAAVPQAFFTLVDALGGEQDSVVDSLQDPGGLLFSMMRAASRKLPEDIVDSAHPAVLRAVALSPNADFAVRLEAAERAETSGALSAQELAEIYASVPFEASELSDPVAAAGDRWGPRARALMVRAATAQESLRGRAEILRKAWELGREKGGFDLMLRVSAPILLSIDPAAELLWFAGDAGRSLFATGHSARAMAWFQLAASNADSNKEARAAWVALWPLAQLAAPEDGPEWKPDGLNRWWQSRSADKDEAARRTVRVLFSLFESLGKPVGGALWRQLISDVKHEMTATPNAALWHSLRNASNGSRVGETVLLSLLVLTENGSGAINPLTLNAVIGALRGVGLDKEARALAVEAAIAAGV